MDILFLFCSLVDFGLFAPGLIITTTKSKPEVYCRDYYCPKNSTLSSVYKRMRVCVDDNTYQYSKPMYTVNYERCKDEQVVGIILLSVSLFLFVILGLLFLIFRKK